jgi:hypothetical protein
MRPGDGECSVHRPDFPSFFVISEGCHGLTHKVPSSRFRCCVGVPPGRRAFVSPKKIGDAAACGFPGGDEALFAGDNAMTMRSHHCARVMQAVRAHSHTAKE